MALGVARSTAYYQRSIDPSFAAAWEEAQEQDADRYEDALDDAAIRMKNIGAIIFGLKNKRPGKWQDRHDVKMEKREAKVDVSLSPGSEQEWLALVKRRLESGNLLPPPPDVVNLEGSEKRGQAS